jgi:hypothetical protein
MIHGIPRVHAPPAMSVNPFLVRVHCLSKDVMRRTLMYQFGPELVNFVLQSPMPFVYPTVIYGAEWVCTIYVLY